MLCGPPLPCAASARHAARWTRSTQVQSCFSFVLRACLSHGRHAHRGPSWCPTAQAGARRGRSGGGVPIRHMRIPMRAHWSYAYPHARALHICVSPCAPSAHMRIPIRAPLNIRVSQWAIPLGVCVSPYAPFEHMRIPMRAHWAYACPHALPYDICISPRRHSATRSSRSR